MAISEFISLPLNINILQNASEALSAVLQATSFAEASQKKFRTLPKCHLNPHADQLRVHKQSFAFACGMNIEQQGQKKPVRIGKWPCGRQEVSSAGGGPAVGSKE